MSKQDNSRRIANGCLTDGVEDIRFIFDGKTYKGQRGDTLASALLANNVHLVARSFKYHRPRGLMSAGVEEASALVTIGEDEYADPNVRATMQEIYPGMVAKSQNRFPSLRWDFGAINSFAAPILGAGFYYKTFFEFGLKGWMFCESLIRKAAGLGIASRLPDPDRYETMNATCDILIVGGGPTGLLTALEAGRAGANVILVEQMSNFGGQLLGDGTGLNNETPAEWVAAVVAELKTRPNVRMLNRTTAWGYYDGNFLALNERVSEHLGDNERPSNWCRQRTWRVSAKKVMLATGAIERPMLFAHNDRPGIMLAGAVRTYLRLFGVTVGRNLLCLGNDDSIYETALAYASKGVPVKVVDTRAQVPEALIQLCNQHNIRLFANAHPIEAKGRKRVHGLEIEEIDGHRLTLTCDAIAMSGGWTPSVHLASQAGGKPRFNEQIQAFVPGEPREDWVAVGAVEGHFDTRACFERALSQVRHMLDELGIGADGRTTLPTVQRCLPMAGQRDAVSLLSLKVEKKHKAFLDPQHDVTAKDVFAAHREGFVSVEHLKRYTTLGMATDQGKTSNVLGLALMAQAREMSLDQVGTTTFRAPFTPITMGSLVGREIREHVMPVRKTSLHAWHEENGARFIEAGLWMRAHYYPSSETETLREAYIREASHVRAHCGICDVATLGKIDVQGPDAATFLNRIYANGFAKLPVGKARYGLMLREDGIPFDDGTTTRLSQNQYYMTTTTGEAAHVLQWLEHKLDVVWPDLKVKVSSITDQWCNMALAGPKARDVLNALLEDVDVSNKAVPFMASFANHFEHKGQDIPLRVFRISFSGELGYELATPSRFGRILWEKLLAVGTPFQCQPYGLEAMGALRVEKGFITHADMNGRTTLGDLGLAKMASTKKDYIGKPMLNREGMTDPDRPTLVGIIPLDSKSPVAAGGQIVPDAKLRQDYSALEPANFLGHISSTTYSPVLKKNVGLGFVRGGWQGQEDKVFYVADPVRGNHYPIKVTNPDMIDPEGARSNG